MINLFSLPLRFLINAIQWVRCLLYKVGLLKSYSLSGYVVSVGNVEFGGTGKTPLVMYLLESFVQKGFRPVVLTRGYGSSLSKDEFAIMINGEVVFGSKVLHADEPTLISKKNPSVPLVIGQRRKDAALHFLGFSKEYQPTHWIIDDGFQHLSIKRDFDICLVTGDFIDVPYIHRSFSREFLFSKNRADLVLLTKSNNSQSKIDRCDFIVEEVYHSGSLKSLDKKVKISLFAGIAKPHFLKDQLKELGYEVVHECFVGDHALLSENAFNRLAQKGLPIVMTEKDFYRQEHFFSTSGIDIYLVRQKVQVDELLFRDIYAFPNS